MRRNTARWSAAMPPAATRAYTVAPSFWSEQYDLYIQGVGWPVAQPSARVRRKISDKATLLFELDGAHIAYAIGINAQRDIATIAPADRAAHRGRCRRACGPGEAAECYAAGKELKGHVMANGTKERVGIVGAGRMGFSMLKHLVKKGFSVTACDLSAEALEARRRRWREDRGVAGRAGEAMRFRDPRRRLHRRGQCRGLRQGWPAREPRQGRDHRGVVHHLAVTSCRRSTRPPSRRASACLTRRSAAAALPPTKARCWRSSAASPTWSSAGARSIRRSAPTMRISAMPATARSARP